MLNRQRVLLELLQAASRPVTKIELMKWSFVLSRETHSQGGSAFYEFLPYDFGPFSFCLSREAHTLAELGLVEEQEKTWALHPDLAMVTHGLASRIRDDVHQLVNRFVQKPVSDLIDYVYSTYPAYTVNSKLKRLAIRPCAIPAAYTAGYEGLQVDGFLDMLVQNGIQMLIDVRNNPVARRYGYHKSTLKRLCESLKIEYQHFPELGIVSNQRQNLTVSAGHKALFDRYEAEMLPQQPEALERVLKLMTGQASVLVCMEACASLCHRSRLASKVASRTGLPIVHLVPSHA